MELRHDGTVAITGAASYRPRGGAAAARQGWNRLVWTRARPAGRHRRAVRLVPDRFKPIICDVTDATRVAAAFAEINFITPTLDALICCAGILRTAPLESMRVEEFDQARRQHPRPPSCAPRSRCRCCARPRRRTARAHLLLSSVAALRPKYPRCLCRVESRGQPVVPRHGVEWAHPAAGECSGARHGRYAMSSNERPRRRKAIAHPACLPSADRPARRRGGRDRLPAVRRRALFTGTTIPVTRHPGRLRAAGSR